MASTTFSSVLLIPCLILFIVFTTISRFSCASADERKVYVVYMGSLPDGDYSPAAHHTTILEEVLESSSVSDVMVRSYRKSFNGFAAKLTEVERQRLASRGEVVSIFPSKTLRSRTSRSWDFTGLLETSNRIPSVESDIIIGVIDGGIWPDSPSFTDVGFPPVPTKWKGVCAGGANFTCNKKILGARYYLAGEVSALDKDGHGSHTSSIAAGNNVKDASFFGVGTGLVRGAVPSARIAVYKVCNVDSCTDDAVLSAFDDAIADGVDILTISLGPNGPLPLLRDSIAIGSFHAMTKNILTTHCAGNDGPQVSSVSSTVPWLFSVAASSTDRRFLSKLVLGSNKEFMSNGLNSFTLEKKDYPIVFGKDSGTKCDEASTRNCTEGCLVPELVKGKIVICTGSLSTVAGALAAGAAGAIVSYEHNDYSVIVPFPAAVLSQQDFELVVAYYASTTIPSANILKSEGVKVGSPPEVVSFSSRGPNFIIPDILKPDISAPGVDILAAYSPEGIISKPILREARHNTYSVLSGTSMSCPHAAGAAAYVKTFHPDWSPSAIKSAIMTTAWPMNNTHETAGGFGYEFAYGSGHINPVKAVNPGLVYETTTEEYVKMLCGIGLSQDDVGIISGDKSSCSAATPKPLPRDMNYPSMAASLNSSAAAAAFSVTFTRTVTNVGSPTSVYKSTVINRNDKTISVAIAPSTMSFKSVGEKMTFTATVTSSTGFTGMVSANLVWSDGQHNVRSPIIVYSP